MTGHGADQTRAFYDELAPTYDLVYADWAASVSRQGAVLDALLSQAGVLRSDPVLDCACGIGTQTIGLAETGRQLTGTDLSPVAVARARRESDRRGHAVLLAAADMRALPFADRTFSAVVCADNSLPHLTTVAALTAGLTEIARVLRPGGILLASTRDYDGLREQQPTATPPSVRETADGRNITFQLWHWHEDGERYDYEHFQIGGDDGQGWTVARRTATYWAVTRRQLELVSTAAGLVEPTWHEPDSTGFFQPVLMLRRGLTSQT